MGTFLLSWHRLLRAVSLPPIIYSSIMPFTMSATRRLALSARLVPVLALLLATLSGSDVRAQAQAQGQGQGEECFPLQGSKGCPNLQGHCKFPPSPMRNTQARDVAMAHTH